MIEYVLTDLEVIAARAEGRRRQLWSDYHGTDGRNGGPARGPAAKTANLIGAAGELVVAIELGLVADCFADEAPSKGLVDLPGRIDVKTGRRPTDRMIVQLDDEPTKRFVLVTYQGTPRHFAIHGWLPGHEAMRHEHRHDPAGGRPAYFIGASRLRPLDELRWILIDEGIVER